VLDGAKTFVTNASLAEVITVVARTDPHAPSGQAFTAFLVPTDRAGFSVSRHVDKMGCRSSPTGELAFDAVELSDDDILGEPGTALWKIAFECFAWERTVMIASPIGGMRRDLDAAVAYAKDRQAFGGAIGRFGQIQHKLTEMRMHLEAASLLQRQAAWRRDHGLDHEVEASLAKKYVGEFAVAGALDAIQIHGGWGYTTEFAVERGLRDAKLASLGGGTTEIQEMIVARRLLGT
jgi:alkylation response protein AidB-like acyl-CoA dehydrogenase